MAIGLCLFLGGVGMYVAGLWEFAAGNTFGVLTTLCV
jgi:succinate-acetate transporter protein